MTETNWAGSYTYRAARLERPASVEALQDLVARSDRVRPLGSRHSFTDLADTDGVLVSTADLPATLEVDDEARTATVGGGTLYGALAAALHARGWALSNMASLPHISVAGAVATGTHGSGDRNGSLAVAVRAIEVVGPDGGLRRLARGDEDFDGSVVALGALGVVTKVTLDVEPAYEVRQVVYTRLPWSTVESDLAAVTGAGYSVSLFTDWTSDTVAQVWVKSRDRVTQDELFGAPAASIPLHMLVGAPTAAVTGQLGEPGPWHERLPHFRMEFTPSRGEELQSEYLVPRDQALLAFEELRRLGTRFAPVLQVAEVRTVAADPLWLSPAYGTDVVGLHFTWVRDQEAIDKLLPAIEDVLLPLGARPHWGKVFAAERDRLAPLYPRYADFAALRDRVDPSRTFGNAFLDRVLGS